MVAIFKHMFPHSSSHHHMRLPAARVTSLPMTLATVLEAPTRMVDVSTAPRHSGLRLMFVDTFRHSIIALLYATLIQYKLIIGLFVYLHFPSSL